MDINVKQRTLKLLEKFTGNLQDLGLGKEFLDFILNA